MKKLLIIGLCFFFVMPFVSCDNDNEEPPIVIPDPDPTPNPGPDPDNPFSNTWLFDNEVLISHIVGIPGNVTFDKVKVQISGKCWDIIQEVEAAYEDGKIILSLPTEFPAESLSQVVRSGDSSSETYYCGFWPGTSDDTDALVAGLGDIIAYKGEQRVGMISLTDWSGEGSVVDKLFVFYHYADRPFKLSGSNASYIYNASFKKGWNAYGHISQTEGGRTLCTTTIEEEALPVWYFKSWIY